MMTYYICDIIYTLNINNYHDIHIYYIPVLYRQSNCQFYPATTFIACISVFTLIISTMLFTYIRRHCYYLYRGAVIQHYIVLYIIFTKNKEYSPIHKHILITSIHTCSLPSPPPSPPLINTITAILDLKYSGTLCPLKNWTTLTGPFFRHIGRKESPGRGALYRVCSVYCIVCMICNVWCMRGVVCI